MKPAGDISSVFPSLSGVAPAPLHPRFASLKRQYLNGRENELQSGWERLIGELKREVEEVKELGSKVCLHSLLGFLCAYTDRNNNIQAIPSIEFKHLATASPVEIAEIKRRGVVVIRNVLPENEALQLKADIRDYLRENSNAKGSLEISCSYIITRYIQPLPIRKV